MYSLYPGFRLTLCQAVVFIATLLFLPTVSHGQSLPGPGNNLPFNGINTYINCGTSDRGITKTVTAEAWIKTTSSAIQFAVTKYANSLPSFSESGFQLGTSGGQAGMFGRLGLNNYFFSGLSSTFVNDGRWHHLAGEVDGNTWRIYVDGVLENSNTYTYTGGSLSTPEPMTIGAYTYTSSFYFDGEIDEVRVWRTARSQAEIRDNMCRKFVTAPAALVAYYRFDQANSAMAIDNGSVPNNGTLINLSSNSWHLSGAPLGDASVYSYQTAGPASSRVALITATGDSAIAHSTSASVQGVQLYAVNTAPSIAPPSAGSNSYVGVFTVGGAPASRTYALRLRPSTGSACRTIFFRVGNELAWALPGTPPTITATSLLVTTALYRGEYILSPDIAVPVTIAGDSLVCAGARTQLRVVTTGSATYRWNTGATTATLPNLGPGTYTVTVSFASGCTQVLRRTVRTTPPPVLTISGDSTMCPGGGTTLTAAAPGATGYRWTTGASTPSLAISQPGTYGVTVTYGLGCTVAGRREVRLNAAAPPAFVLGADTTLCEGDQLLLQGPAGPALRYQWSDGSTSRQLLVQTAGRYTLRVFTTCGEQNAARNVAVRSCLLVPNIVTANADHRNDYFAVQGLKGDGWALDVYNRWGRAVFQTANYHNEWGLDAAPGLYYIMLRRPATGYQYKGWVEVLR